MIETDNLAVACGESPLGYTYWLCRSAEDFAVACGESPLGYTGTNQRNKLVMLWLVGNRRSDTLARLDTSSTFSLWLVGNRRSDTLYRQSQFVETRCGLWGIAARIHSVNRRQARNKAVACGESPLGYTAAGLGTHPK